MFSPFLGQVPLILGPSSWGAGIPLARLETPPYFGEWSLLDDEGGKIGVSGRVGPFSTWQEAFQSAAVAARNAGTTHWEGRFFDSNGVAVGPVI